MVYLLDKIKEAANREAFEQWARSESLDTGRESEGDLGYVNAVTHYAWLAWQAALDAPKVVEA